MLHHHSSVITNISSTDSVTQIEEFLSTQKTLFLEKQTQIDNHN